MAVTVTRFLNKNLVTMTTYSKPNKATFNNKSPDTVRLRHNTVNPDKLSVSVLIQAFDNPFASDNISIFDPAKKEHPGPMWRGVLVNNAGGSNTSL